MFEEKMNEMLEEGFGTSSVMDVNELRRLYYGRLDMFVSFSNDDRLKTNERPTVRVPSGVTGHSVFDVVGRKVKDAAFYAHVFRFNTRANFIQNIKTYNTTDLKSDILKLVNYQGLDEEVIAEIVQTSLSKSILRSPFQKLWDMTREIAMTQNRANSGVVWRELFLFLGYYGISDPHGTGILTGGRKKHPVSIFFIEPGVIDIVPIQKNRKDERRRVINNVDRSVAKMSTSRNRIAKRRFRNRKKLRAGSFLSTLLGAMNALSL
jgi:hypothetical protein